MAPQQSKRVIIVGAGLAGALMACYLAKAGWQVRMYERRPDPRVKGYVGGRSINLALSARGLAGLAGAGLAERVMANDAIPMPGRMIHPLAAPGSAGSLVFQPYSKDPGDAINAVSRGGLNLTLLRAADEHDKVEMFFDHPCIDVDLAAPAAVFQTPGGGTTRVEADLIIGADGAFSAVRGVMQKTDRFDYSQSYLEHGYKELHIPSAADLDLDGDRHNGFAMEPSALHIWPRGGAMMIALPNRDRTFTCTLFWPFTGPHGFERLRTPGEVLLHFSEYYPDAVPLMPTLTDDYFRNPTSSLVTVRCWPWQREGKVVLIGDAAHAIVPFYGQGMNCAFEDCLALARCLETYQGKLNGQLQALEEFQAQRKPNADAIADMALENFVEMRDKVGQPAFLYKKRVEQAVHGLFPDTMVPQYNLVSFSTVPYAEAQRRGRELDGIFTEIARRLPPEQAEGMSSEAWTARIRDLVLEIAPKAVKA
jgi:kynurenine 3-monooxygenase